MKSSHSIVFYLVFFFCAFAEAQNYPSINNHSAYLVNATAWDLSFHFWVFDEKDTLINSKTYRKYVEQGNSYPLALIREDLPNKRVYRFANNEEALLFDFSLHLMDTITLNNGFRYKVDVEDSIVVAFGEKRRRLVLNH